MNHPHIKTFQLEQVKRGDKMVKHKAINAKIWWFEMDDCKMGQYNYPGFKRLQLI